MKNFIKQNRSFLIIATVITVLSLLKIGNAHAAADCPHLLATVKWHLEGVQDAKLDFDIALATERGRPVAARAAKEVFQRRLSIYQSHKEEFINECTQQAKK